MAERVRSYWCSVVTSGAPQGRTQGRTSFTSRTLATAVVAPDPLVTALNNGLWQEERHLRWPVEHPLGASAITPAAPLVNSLTALGKIHWSITAGASGTKTSASDKMHDQWWQTHGQGYARRTLAWRMEVETKKGLNERCPRVSAGGKPQRLHENKRSAEDVQVSDTMPDFFQKSMCSSPQEVTQDQGVFSREGLQRRD